MNEYDSKFKNESNLIVMELGMDYASIHVSFEQMVCVLLDKHRWFYDQKIKIKKNSTQKKAWISNWCEIKRDQCVIVTPLRREECEEEDVNNVINKMTKYIEDEDEQKIWEFIDKREPNHGHKTNADMMEINDKKRKYKLLDLLRQYLEQTRPLIITRCLGIYKEEELNEMKVIRKGCLSTFMRNIMDEIEIKGNKEKRIGNVVIIDTSYYVIPKGMAKTMDPYPTDIKAFYIPIKFEREELDYDDYTETFQAHDLLEKGDGAWWTKYKRITESQWELKAGYEVLAFENDYGRYYDRFSEILTSPHFKSSTNWTICYGYEEFEKLENMRMLKNENNKKKLQIEALMKKVKELEDLLKQQQD